jgi:hypothetical protein
MFAAGAFAVVVEVGAAEAQDKKIRERTRTLKYLFRIIARAGGVVTRRANLLSEVS